MVTDHPKVMLTAAGDITGNHDLAIRLKRYTKPIVNG